MTSWTNEQLSAINAEGSNIIVSAGAGSGKTAVLTERVITKLKKGIHLDDLLILTFTNNAAAEMKTRIKKEILKNENIASEAAKIDSADITTFDAFTLSLVKKYHYYLNIDKDLNIIDSSIIKLKKKDIINQIFETYYSKKNPLFIDFVTTYGVKNDKLIKKIILNLDEKIDLLYNSKDFLNNYINNYYNDENIEKLFNQFETILQTRIETIKSALDVLQNEVTNDFYQKYYDALLPLLNAKNYDEIRLNLNIDSFRLPSKSSEIAKNAKEKITKVIKVLKSYTYYNKAILINDLVKTKDNSKLIIEIILELNTQITNYKNKYQAYEFGDISKMAIDLLKNNESVLLSLKNKYQEIMIDEYQDTSDIEELFISLIQNNNVYMVGDIKQSIYRFRNANPNIFKNKYDKYKNNNGGQKIDLNKNFRSRENVLSSINNIFIHIMDDKIGNANYKKEHKLIFGNLSFNTKKINDDNLEIYNYEKDNRYTKEEIESFIIANDIKEKINNNYNVLDNENRPCTYKDFCILMDRSTNFDIYKKVFDYYGIPLCICKDEDISLSDETSLINNIIGLIMCIKNKTYNNKSYFYYTSIARSYLFEEDDEIIYKIVTNKDLFSTEIFKICQNIANNIEKLSNKEILYMIIDEFKFYDKMIKVGNTFNRTVTLNNLLNKFEELNKVEITFEKINDYLSSLISENEAIKVSNMTSNENAVTITNIHKSKGLEYKICYYSGLHKQFNFDDVKNKFLFNNNYGIILPVYEEGIKPTFVSFLNKENYIKEEISEKLRLFYVALTRAKEKMIIVTELKNNEEIWFNNDVIDYLTRISYKNFNDILFSIYPQIKKYIKNITIPQINNGYIFSSNLNITYNNDNAIEVNELENNSCVINVKRYSKEENHLLSEEELANMEYGHKIHQALEYFDFKKPNYDKLSSNEKDIIESLMNNKIFDNIKNGQIFKEYEFIDNDETVGIIDLMIIYNDHIDIIDYKLKNISDEAYTNQLKGYQKYIANKTNKKTNIYLYSLISKKLVKIN